MTLVDHHARALRVAQICRERGITQSQIATAIRASQAQVSRVLSGRGLRGSRVSEDVCLYVESFDRGVTADAVRENDDLVEAMRAAWDGTASHARALAAVIRSLSALKSRSGRADPADTEST